MLLLSFLYQNRIISDMTNPDRMRKSNCSIDATMSVIEGRWKGVILCKLATAGPMRFCQISKEIEKISPRILTIQLKEMEKDGLVSRIQYPEIPPRVEYSITEKGRSLGPILIAMAEWGMKYGYSDEDDCAECGKRVCPNCPYGVPQPRS